MLIFELFNTPDIAEKPSRLKPIYLLGIYFCIPCYVSLHTGEKYYRYFKKAQKQIKKIFFTQVKKIFLHYMPFYCFLVIFITGRPNT